MEFLKIASPQCYCFTQFKTKIPKRNPLKYGDLGTLWNFELKFTNVERMSEWYVTHSEQSRVVLAWVINVGRITRVG